MYILKTDLKGSITWQKSYKLTEKGAGTYWNAGHKILFDSSTSETNIYFSTFESTTTPSKLTINTHYQVNANNGGLSNAW